MREYFYVTLNGRDIPEPLLWATVGLFLLAAVVFLTKGLK